MKMRRKLSLMGGGCSWEFSWNFWFLTHPPQHVSFLSSNYEFGWGTNFLIWNMSGPSPLVVVIPPPPISWPWPSWPWPPAISCCWPWRVIKDLTSDLSSLTPWHWHLSWFLHVTGVMTTNVTFYDCLVNDISCLNTKHFWDHYGSKGLTAFSNDLTAYASGFVIWVFTFTYFLRLASAACAMGHSQQ